MMLELVTLHLHLMYNVSIYTCDHLLLLSLSQFLLKLLLLVLMFSMFNQVVLGQYLYLIILMVIQHLLLPGLVQDLMDKYLMEEDLL